MIFAASTPEANSFLQFWIIIGFIASILSNVVLVIINLSGRKQRRAVSFEAEPASREEFREHAKANELEFGQIWAEMKKDREAAVEAAQISRAGLYKKMDEFRKELSEHTDAVRKELNDKIDDIPDRVITTLKNTGAI